MEPFRVYEHQRLMLGAGGGGGRHWCCWRTTVALLWHHSLGGAWGRGAEGGKAPRGVVACPTCPHTPLIMELHLMCYYYSHKWCNRECCAATTLRGCHQAVPAAKDQCQGRPAEPPGLPSSACTRATTAAILSRNPGWARLQGGGNTEGGRRGVSAGERPGSDRGSALASGRAPTLKPTPPRDPWCPRSAAGLLLVPVPAPPTC